MSPTSQQEAVARYYTAEKYDRAREVYSRPMNLSDVEMLQKHGIEVMERFWSHVVPSPQFKRELPVFGLPGIRYYTPEGRECYHWSKKFEEKIHADTR